MHNTYPIILIPAEEGGYSVLVPDLPGCHTQGETVEEALEMAKDAMSGWIEVAIDDREEVPKPSSLQDVVGRLNDILQGIVETEKEREQIIITLVKIEIPKAAA